MELLSKDTQAFEGFIYLLLGYLYIPLYVFHLGDFRLKGFLYGDKFRYGRYFVLFL